MAVSLLMQGLETVRAFREQNAFQLRCQQLIDGNTRTWWTIQARSQVRLPWITKKSIHAFHARGSYAYVASPCVPWLTCPGSLKQAASELVSD